MFNTFGDYLRNAEITYKNRGERVLVLPQRRPMLAVTSTGRIVEIN